MSRSTVAESPSRHLADSQAARMPGLKESPVPEFFHEKPQPSRRFWAAWLYDYLASFWLAVGTIFIVTKVFPSANLQLLVVASLFYLTRDYFFEGRGFGKNLLGLQVLNARTLKPASFTQSVVRNLYIFAPYFIHQSFALLLDYVPIPCGQEILFAIKYLGIAYFLIALIIDNQLLYKGSGVRLADRVAGTIVVKQDKPDFSNPFSLSPKVR